MECSYHPGVQAAGYCSACSRPVCQACLTVQGNRSVCPVCAAASTAPPTPAAPTYVAPAPVANPPASGSKGWLHCGLGCCGGLLLVGLVVGAYFGYRWYQSQPSQGTTKATTTTTPAADSTTKSSDSSAPAEPGQAAADQAARASHPSYAGQLMYRSADWKRVKLWMGPSKSPLNTELILQWNAQKKAYEVERDAAIQRPTRATAKPGEAAAKAEALAKHPSWVAKIMYHSPDWQRVKVWIGPPSSEFVSELILQWNNTRNQYDVERAGSIPKEPEGPRPSREGAIAAARQGVDYAIAKVESRNADWTRVTVLFGGEASEFDTTVTVQWTDRGYEVVDMGPLDTGSGDAAAWDESHPNG